MLKQNFADIDTALTKITIRSMLTLKLKSDTLKFEMEFRDHLSIL